MARRMIPSLVRAVAREMEQDERDAITSLACPRCDAPAGEPCRPNGTAHAQRLAPREIPGQSRPRTCAMKSTVIRLTEQDRENISYLRRRGWGKSAAQVIRVAIAELARLEREREDEPRATPRF